MEAAREGTRGAGAGAMAGRVLAQSQQSQGEIASAQAEALYALEKAKADKEASIQKELANLSLAEVEGAQTAARDAEKLRALAMSQGMSQVNDLAGQLAGMPELYKQDRTKTETKTGAGFNAPNVLSSQLFQPQQNMGLSNPAIVGDQKMYANLPSGQTFVTEEQKRLMQEQFNADWLKATAPNWLFGQ
jgi:hypothetical protein